MNISTGLPTLDDLLGSGLNENSKILLYGRKSSGKTIVCIKFLAENKKKKCVYITTSDSENKILEKALKNKINLKKGEITVLKTNSMKKIKEKIEEKNVKIAVIDELQDALGLKNKKTGLSKFKEINKKMRELENVLGKENALMATLDSAEMNNVEIKILEDYFDRSADVKKKGENTYVTVTKTDRIEILNKEVKLEENLVEIEVRKFFE